MRRQGRIVEWHGERGFGFVLWNGGDERAFAHIIDFSDRGGMPAVGDIVTYDLGPGEPGRARATNIRYAVAAAPVRARGRLGGRQGPANALAALLGVALLGAGAFHVDRLATQRALQAPPVATGYRPAPPLAATAAPVTTLAARGDAGGFACTGKQHCSEMASCAEARFHARHCPGMKIDGDGDGIPCEELCPGF